MPTEQPSASRDERLVTVPIWIIDAVRAEVRLEIHVWSEMARHVDDSLAQGEQALPCDVKLPPATVFLKGTKVSTLMLGIQQRQPLCEQFRTKLGALVLAGKIEAPDVLVGGTPCQAFSVAGMRQGLVDPRGALTIKYVELADATDYVRAIDRKPPCVIVWENVPGALNDKGNAFGCFLGAPAGKDCELQPSGKSWPDAGCVYGPKRTIAWRVLDAQYFGLAQRSRRVFVVASARDGFDPTEVLFEREGTRRDSPPGQEEKSALHPTLTAQGGGALDDREAYVLEPYGVRRTSVNEWERCQGFPNDYTLIPWRGKPASECLDGPRYEAIGNSKAITVVRWIGRRLLYQM